VAGDKVRRKIDIINDVNPDHADDVEVENLSDEKKTEANDLALTLMGNISRKTLHKHITKDLLFEGNHVLMKRIQKQRRKTIYRKKRKYQLILILFVWRQLTV
jgi:hypothetical protein